MSGLFQKLSEKAAAVVGKKSERVYSPTLGSATRFPYGPFQFKTQVARGAEYDIQASTDLQNWLSASKDVATGQPFEYVDSDASKFSHRFYRVIAGGLLSTNVVGYASVTLPPGFSMIANPLDTTSNSVAELFKGWPDGTTLSKFDTRFFKLTENAMKLGKWTNPSEKLKPGEGGIFFNPTSDYKAHSFVGDVLQGNLSIPLPAGFSIHSSLVPQNGRLDEDLRFPIAEGDVIHIFDRDQQKYVLHPYEGGKWAAGPPLVSVGESFWVAKTSPNNWTRNFIIAL